MGRNGSPCKKESQKARERDNSGRGGGETGQTQGIAAGAADG